MLRNADIEMFTNAKNFRSVKKVQKPVFNNMSLSLDVKFAPRGELRPPGVNTRRMKGRTEGLVAKFTPGAQFHF
jgi:hypothetical protein